METVRTPDPTIVAADTRGRRRGPHSKLQLGVGSHGDLEGTPSEGPDRIYTARVSVYQLPDGKVTNQSVHWV